LKEHEYFGQYGKILKVVVNHNSTYAGSQGPSLSAYVTYSKMEEALSAVNGVNNVLMDGRILKASLGTTKYCSTYLKNQQCNKVDCMYLHEAAEEEASFTKEDMQIGKHQEFERKLMQEMLARNEAHRLESLKNNEIKTEPPTVTPPPPTKALIRKNDEGISDQPWRKQTKTPDNQKPVKDLFDDYESDEKSTEPDLVEASKTENHTESQIQQQNDKNISDKIVFDELSHDPYQIYSEKPKFEASPGVNNPLSGLNNIIGGPDLPVSSASTRPRHNNFTPFDSSQVNNRLFESPADLKSTVREPRNYLIPPQTNPIGWPISVSSNEYSTGLIKAPRNPSSDWLTNNHLLPPESSFQAAYRNENSIISQPKRTDDDDDLDFDVFREGEKEFADVVNRPIQQITHRSNFISPVFEAVKKPPNLQQSPSTQNSNFYREHLRSQAFNGSHNFINKNQITNQNVFGDSYNSNGLDHNLLSLNSLPDYENSKLPFPQAPSGAGVVKDRRNMLKRLLPPSVKVKFTTQTDGIHSAIQNSDYMDVHRQQQQQQQNSRFAPFMSPRNDHLSTTQNAQSLFSTLPNWAPTHRTNALQSQMSNLSLSNDRNGFSNSGSYSTQRCKIDSNNFAPLGPPPGLVSSNNSSSYDPAIIAASSQANNLLRHQDPMYSSEEPHWMRSLHTLTDTDGPSTPPHKVDIDKNKNSSNNIHDSRSSYFMPQSSWSINKSVDTFSPLQQQPPPGFH